MRIVDIKKDKYNLHFIKTNKFKTTLVKVIFYNNLKKEELIFFLLSFFITH